MFSFDVGSFLGGVTGGRGQDRANRRNIAFQREFAQNSLQWRAADAEAAGIHPLAAMGAATSQPSVAIQPETSALEAAARAIRPGKSAEEIQLEKLQRKNLEADIAVKQAEASAIRNQGQQPQVVRPMHIPVYDRVSGETFYMVDPEIAESMDSMAANMATVYGNTQTAAETRAKADRHTIKHGLKKGAPAWLKEKAYRKLGRISPDGKPR